MLGCIGVAGIPEKPEDGRRFSGVGYNDGVACGLEYALIGVSEGDCANDGGGDKGWIVRFAIMAGWEDLDNDAVDGDVYVLGEDGKDVIDGLKVGLVCVGGVCAVVDYATIMSTKPPSQ